MPLQVAFSAAGVMVFSKIGAIRNAPEKLLAECYAHHREF
jgi:hypothetical protein